ncbi:ATP-binding protein (plasmid) [Neorhizobium galegae]|nr:ATP-binding protein [Neorhizobium galegae]
MEDLMSHSEIGLQAKNDFPLSVAGAAAKGHPPDSIPGTVHDLGNLIQVAVSALNILSRNAHLAADPSLPPIVSSARMSLARAGTLVEQTLRRAREGAASVEAVSIGGCLSELRELVEKIWEPEIQLDVQVESDLPPLTCSRINLQGAIMNLLTNARDAMPDGGTIALAARRAAKGGSTAAVEIEILDNGLGMSADTLQRAFEPFFTTRATGLGGFGLPVVKRFVEEVGGHIAVESKLNAGTQVTMYLPIAVCR